MCIFFSFTKCFSKYTQQKRNVLVKLLVQFIYKIFMNWICIQLDEPSSEHFLLIYWMIGITTFNLFYKCSIFGILFYPVHSMYCLKNWLFREGKLFMYICIKFKQYSFVDSKYSMKVIVMSTQCYQKWNAYYFFFFSLNGKLGTIFFIFVVNLILRRYKNFITQNETI